jgi:Fe-S-cluster containining protein
MTPPVPDCGTCGACCREAFDSVPVGPEDEATARAHPALVRVEADTGWRDLQRVPSPTGCGTRCTALVGDGAVHPFRCRIYPHRPTACRELEPGSPNCHLARQRVGLEPPPDHSSVT